MTREFAAALNQLSRERDVLLIADEVQTGLGRCGTLYASQAVGLKPDIITLSKPLAGGLPLSATLIRTELNETLQVGDHASTFGGGPVTCTAANFVWDELHRPGFMEKLRDTAAYLEERLHVVRDGYPRVFAPEALRGLGMLRGLVVKDSGQLPRIISRSMDEGLLLLRSGSNVLRLAPPLVIERKQIDEMGRQTTVSIREADMSAEEKKLKRIVLAYSGGLDTFHHYSLAQGALRQSGSHRGLCKCGTAGGLGCHARKGICLRRRQSSYHRCPKGICHRLSLADVARKSRV